MWGHEERKGALKCTEKSHSSSIFHSIRLAIWKNKQQQMDFFSPFLNKIRKSGGILLCRCFPPQLVTQFQYSLTKKDKGIWNIRSCFYAIASWVKRPYCCHAFWKDKTSVIRHEKIHLPEKQIHEKTPPNPSFLHFTAQGTFFFFT